MAEQGGTSTPVRNDTNVVEDDVEEDCFPPVPSDEEDDDGCHDARGAPNPDGLVIVKGGAKRPHHQRVDGEGQGEEEDVDGDAGADARSARDHMYLIAYGIQSKNNLGELLRTAGAMGAREVLVVNQATTKSKVKRNMNTFGAHGADRRVVVRAFASFDILVQWLRRKKVYFFGIEIKPESRSINETNVFDRPGSYTGGVAFMPGNEGSGMHESHAKLCDAFVYIPHFGSATASLNVNAATAIVLHAFASGHAESFSEVGRRGEKFIVDDTPPTVTN